MRHPAPYRAFQPTTTKEDAMPPHIEAVTLEAFADLLEESHIIEKTDHGAHTVHRAVHPVLGEVSLISSIVEPWFLVTA
jgi:hypothetical protein